jgi:hypothetical protein
MTDSTSAHRGQTHNGLPRSSEQYRQRSSRVSLMAELRISPPGMALVHSGLSESPRSPFPIIPVHARRSLPRSPQVTLAI